ncbi:MAG: ATP-dependent DNA helicase RecG [Burkholderiales bacterium]|nr:ATP-dependent DNA helicase RecG [Burkholderiales bacterium]
MGGPPASPSGAVAAVHRSPFTVHSSRLTKHAQPHRASGASKAGLLAKLGIRTQFDLVLHLPLRYEDETTLTAIAQAREGAPVQIEGEVLACDVAYRPRRQLVVKLADATGVCVMRFLNFYPSQQKALAPGTRVRAFGEVRPGFFGGEMIHPRYRVLRVPEPLPEALTPVYPTTAGLSQHALRRSIGAALGAADLSDTLPEATRARLGLAGFAESVRLLHHPQPDTDAEGLRDRTHPAWRRIKFDELLGQQLSMRAHYRARSRETAPALAAGKLTERLRAGLPFRLTRAQARAWDEIERDLGRAHPMHRLLQGDVGSGKTVVAALAVLRAVESGRQAAVMAPTEILAEQHYRKFSQWLAPLGVRVAWLAGSRKKTERRRIAAEIAAGAVPVAIGTHALFQEGVAFRDLALAVVDEQHRFGVRQRLALREKGEAGGALPHQLMMSATPIPRTLSMSYYADLDVSVIDELPPGRTPVVTKLVADTRREEVIARIRAACNEGRQAYWVCPLIEESEALELKTAIETHARLAAELAGPAVGLVHGRLAPAEKAAVMDAFAAGRVQVLVATTVIEVGVDVPNASLMVIEHAERFGLAQLHQLRGRIGRGAQASVCILLYQQPLSEGARRRLRVVYESTDGFRIAHEDLLLRGPGEVLGSRQSGVPLLRFADLVQDEPLLRAARAVADELLERDPQAAARHMQRWMGGRTDLLKA